MFNFFTEGKCTAITQVKVVFADFLQVIAAIRQRMQVLHVSDNSGHQSQP